MHVTPGSPNLWQRFMALFGRKRWKLLAERSGGVIEYRGTKSGALALAGKLGHIRHVEEYPTIGLILYDPSSK